MKQTTQTAASLRLAASTESDNKKIARKSINRSRMTNLLNRINFRDGSIDVHFKHNKYDHIIIIQAKPQICNNDFIRCLWSEHFDAEKRLKHYTFQYFTLANGLQNIEVPGKPIEMNENGIYIELPGSAHAIQKREIKRHRCSGVTANINLDGINIQGQLTSFSAQAFGLKLSSRLSVQPPVIDPATPVNVVLNNKSQFIFSGACEVIRQSWEDRNNYLVLKPLRNNIRLFRPKEVRSERLVLNPLPNIIFKHPLTGRKSNLTLIDISGAGFAVAEDEENALLMPGLILPEVEIEFVHGFSVHCRAQVIYRLSEEDHIRCGLSILDMNTKDHVRLSSYLHQAKNNHSSISTINVDLDELWDFFFESGFIYPDKYLHMLEQKERFKELYRRLYNECPEISRHVIYRDKGKIYGHVAMFRYYRNTWLMHHHAAIKSTRHKAGLVVMEHILQYINECHSLASSQMKYIACYFRPNNRFANRVFGGAARAMEDQQKCSLDNFGYFHFEPEEAPRKLPKKWALEKTMVDDLFVLQHWYRSISGGLMIEGLDLGPSAMEMDIETNKEYSAAGFRRSRQLFTLKYNEEIVALFVVNRADLGMNMSDLTNGIQVFVIDEELLNAAILSTTLSDLSKHYEFEELPVLLYPGSSAEQVGVVIDKEYTLTVLDLDNISTYLLFMHSLTTHKHRKIKHII